MADFETSPRKRKLKSTSLHPCSTKRANGEKHVSNKELALVRRCGDELKKLQGGGESNLLGIPKPAPGRKGRVTFVLENASLTLAFIGKRYRILSSIEHADYVRKKKLNPQDYRPDIIHEALRAILDSILNKEGMVGAIYVKTSSGVVFEFKPHARIPRTCKRFCGLMVELLQKSCVRAEGTGEVLIQVLKKEPLTHLIPENARVIGLSYSSEKVVDIEDYVTTLTDDLDLVFVVGTMVNGKVSKDTKHDYISVSEYRLCSKGCVGLICEALEQKWNVSRHAQLC